MRTICNNTLPIFNPINPKPNPKTLNLTLTLTLHAIRNNTLHMASILGTILNYDMPSDLGYFIITKTFSTPPEGATYTISFTLFHIGDL